MNITANPETVTSNASSITQVRDPVTNGGDLSREYDHAVCEE